MEQIVTSWIHWQSISKIFIRLQKFVDTTRDHTALFEKVSVSTILGLKLGASSLASLDGGTKVLLAFVLDIEHHVQELLPFNHTVVVLVNFLEQFLDLLWRNIGVAQVTENG